MAILAECPICRVKQSVKRKTCKCGEDLDKAKRSKRVKYWIDFKIPGGKARREPVGYSIEEARDAHGKRRVQKRENRIFDMLPESKITFKQLSEWYMDLESVKALASYENGVKLRLKQFNEHFGNMIVNDIKPVDLENHIVRLKKEGRAPGDIDQRIGKVKTMVFKAFENRMIGAEPYRIFKCIKKTVKRGSDVRDRILSKQEFESLITHAKDHTKAIITTAYYTGMRKGEILSLTWDKVNLVKRMIRLEPEDTKDREARNIPICDELYKVLASMPNRIHGAGDPHVFLFQGKPVRDIRDGIKYACRKAGIKYGRFVKDGFIFHDLRHTFNTNMRKAGVPESVIMEITGHSTREMFDRYNSVDQEDTRKAVEQFEVYLANLDQTLDQTKNTDDKQEVDKAGNAD